ncbi:T9SS type A sorting domain-containing protein [Flavobacterium sp. UBA6135]|uniref:T9SS type A sorting domain-containing protein n=1 Tax=Flavobacterium sp. UBA6135 TaxID=1946553 RepID=UPI0025B9807A|nr:T9SS type A sorting domain-containing protein [Flavobacterium sp. UBA6135]
MNKILQLGVLLLSSGVFSQAGNLDASFGVGGKVLTSINSGADKAYGVALQTDGKIVVAGMTTSAVTGRDFACVRYNIDGSLDTSFGTNGIVTNDIQIGSDDEAFSVAIQADGKIVLAGYSDNGSNKSAALIRLNTNGTIDTGFGTSGKVLTDFITNRGDEIKVVKIHGLTGNIVVGGTSSATSTNSQAVIARYNSSGVLDTTFNTTGIVLLPNASGSGTYYYVIEDLAVKSNGKISAVGWINQQGLQWSANHYACRLNSNGTLDTSFSSDGLIVTNGGYNGDDKSFSIVLKQDDSFLFSGGGYLTTLQYDYFLGLYNSTGSSAVGKAFFDFGTLFRDIAYGMGEDSTGKIVLVGSNVVSVSSSTFGIARVNADYTVDSSFGTAGKVTTTFGSNTTNEAFDVAIQTDDKIIAVGYSGNAFALARYTANTLSTDEFEVSNAITVFPNPVKNTLNFNFSNTDFINSKYSIYDLNGRIILEGKIIAAENTINVENLTKGLYLLKIEQTISRFIKD